MRADIPFSLDFDLVTGLCASGKAKPSQRYVSGMIDMFADAEAAQRIADAGDQLVYEFFELDLPETSNDMRFGTSIVHPGQVGDEYFMTKGHFHTLIDVAEVYYCLSGEGLMLMESPEGHVDAQPMAPGQAVYVPGRYAHRTVNTGSVPVVSFFAFRSDAGHDYGTIEEKGFRKLVVNVDGTPALIDNPRWK